MFSLVVVAKIKKKKGNRIVKTKSYILQRSKGNKKKKKKKTEKRKDGKELNTFSISS